MSLRLGALRSTRADGQRAGLDPSGRTAGAARAGYQRAEAREAAPGLLCRARRSSTSARRPNELSSARSPGALIIERNVLEWRLDPTSPYRHPAVTGPDQSIVIFCQAGYVVQPGGGLPPAAWPAMPQTWSAVSRPGSNRDFP